MENKQSILVIDDSPTVRRLAELVLVHEGYAVFTAGDGDDGLKIAKKEVPSLIIVDFIMPKMNGFQLCKNIRSDPILSEVPIVLITSKGKDVGQGFDEKFGIVQYLQKPFETETLARTVKEVLAGREECPGTDPGKSVSGEVSGHVVTNMSAHPQMSEETGSPSETIPVLSDTTYGGSGEETVAEEETVHPVSEVTGDSQKPMETARPIEDIPILSDTTIDETPSGGEKTYGGSGEETVAEEETVHPVSEMTGDSQKPMETSSGGKEAVPEEVPDHIAAAATDSQMSVETDKVAENIPFVEITKGDNTLSAKFIPKTLRPSDSSRHSADAELPSTKETPLESSRTAGSDSGPVEIPREQDEPVVPGYAALQESIEKEFRHYFGRELTALLKSTMIQTLKETDLVRSSKRILSGEIMYIQVADVLQFIGMSGLSGKLSVLTDSFNSEIFLENGQIAFASISKPGYRRCLEELILKDEELCSSEVLDVLYEARGNSLAAGAILRDRGLITKDKLTGYYRELSEDALHQTLSATSGQFYIEDLPLPLEVRDIKLRIPLNRVRE